MRSLQQSAAFVMAVLLCFAGMGCAGASDYTVGDIRVQALSPTLVRLEVKGDKGFEERPTFHVVHRDWSKAKLEQEWGGGKEVVLRGENLVVRIPKGGKSLDGAKVESRDGKSSWTFDGKLTNNRWLPAPSESKQIWSIADAPRLAREGSQWDPTNDADDVYVFVGNPQQIHSDFLKLTGPTEMPPLYALGAWDSRWYAYTEQTALDQIDEYRKRNIPLDVLVVDTDWRKGGSHGYDVNTDDFPDLPRFFREAHDRHVRVMFNDHPEPIATSALDRSEIDYRFENLSRLLNQGLDIWWFDRNWSTHLLSPMQGLRLEAWGMQLYHDITLATRPQRRPMIMANVDGIDNGKRNHPPDMATHRFPIQWTGDIGPSFEFLRRAVENAVHSGVAAAFAYESDDLGGHTSDPSSEGYIRWIEYGALSPIYRPHCTKNLKRMPWAFGDEAEKVARDYVQMRYRLLPVFYAAARENYETGQPILRRLDLDFPSQKEASRDDEYLLGKSILVAPVLSSMNIVTPIPATLLHTNDGRPGLQAEYFDNRDLTGEPALKRVDAQINFDWENASPAPKIPKDNWGARWIGKLGPIPDDGQGDRILSTISDDGIRVWIDGEKVIDAWKGQDSATSEAKVALKPGKTYDLKIEYMDMSYTAVCKLNWRLAKQETMAKRELWLPPGTWIDAWSGGSTTGPKPVEMNVSLAHIPMFIKSGAIVPLAPAMQYTSEKPWDPITLDLYPAAGVSSEATLYEDDGISNRYKVGEFRKTRIKASTDKGMNKLHVVIDPAAGTFEGAVPDRSWKIRIHTPAKVAGIEVDGAAASAQQVPQNPQAMPFTVEGGSADSPVSEVLVPDRVVSDRREITVTLSQ